MFCTGVEVHALISVRCQQNPSAVLKLGSDGLSSLGYSIDIFFYPLLLFWHGKKAAHYALGSQECVQMNA